MCGRFAFSISPEVLVKLYRLEEAPDLPQRFNIAPTQPIPAVLQGRQEARRLLRMMQWGLVPFWAKDPGIGSRMINARSETVAAKPAFRQAFSRRRCLVPASGFYEWQKQPDGKQPYFIRPSRELVFTMAGLWERWEGEPGRVLESCTLLTCPANELMRPIHDRMPVILDPADHALWLDPEVGDPDRLRQLLLPFAADRMEAYPVSKRVNRPAHDAPDCIEPLTREGTGQGGLFPA